jgi:CrcB protein
MIKVLLAGLGGFIGSALRYVISTFFYKLLGTDFPYGTFVVNVLGSFLIGFFMGLVENGFVIREGIKLQKRLIFCKFAKHYKTIRFRDV